MLYSVGMKTPFKQNITFLHTNDLSETARFYDEILELPLVRDQGSCRIYKSSTSSYLGFCTHLDTSSPEGIILTLVEDDVDSWYQQLIENGISIPAPPVQNSDYQIYHFFFKDPNGYTLEIQRFDDPLE
jgi:catechol 2,3-dioxygenase-like lactoylglutathione lyase family enzyme